MDKEQLQLSINLREDEREASKAPCTCYHAIEAERGSCIYFHVCSENKYHECEACALPRWEREKQEDNERIIQTWPFGSN